MEGFPMSSKQPDQERMRARQLRGKAAQLRPLALFDPGSRIVAKHPDRVRKVLPTRGLK